MPLYLCLDGGGTKTTAVIASVPSSALALFGAVVCGRGEAGPSNLCVPQLPLPFSFHHAPYIPTRNFPQLYGRADVTQYRLRIRSLSLRHRSRHPIRLGIPPSIPPPNPILLFISLLLLLISRIRQDMGRHSRLFPSPRASYSISPPTHALPRRGGQTDERRRAPDLACLPHPSYPSHHRDLRDWVAWDSLAPISSTASHPNSEIWGMGIPPWRRGIRLESRARRHQIRAHHAHRPGSSPAMAQRNPGAIWRGGRQRVTSRVYELGRGADAC